MFVGVFLAGCSKGSPPSAKSPTAPTGAENATGASANPIAPGNRQPPPAAAAASSEWKTFTPPDGSYSVLMPGAPQQIPADDATTKNYGMELPGGITYLVSESVRPVESIDAEKGLAALRDAVAGNNQLLFDEELSGGIGPGREFGFVDPDGDAWHVRAYVKGNTVYQLMTLGPSAKVSRDDPGANKFLDSFKLLNAARDDASTDPEGGPR